MQYAINSEAKYNGITDAFQDMYDFKIKVKTK